MRNYLNDDATSIPAKGFGWKLFEIRGDKDSDTLFLGGIVHPHQHYRKGGLNSEGWVNWMDHYVGEGGFCFFLDKRDALDALKPWNWRVGFNWEVWRVGFNWEVWPQRRTILRKIEYRRGLGLNREWNMFFGQREPINVALAKSFRLVNREGRIGL